MPTNAPSVPPNQADPSEADQWQPVGTLVGVQGLRGELRVNPASDFPERFTDPGPRWLQAKGGAPRPVDLLIGRLLPGKSLFVVRLAGLTTAAPRKP